MKNKKIIYGVGIALLLYWLYGKKKKEKSTTEEPEIEKDERQIKPTEPKKAILVKTEPVKKVLVIKDIPKKAVTPRSYFSSNWYTYEYTKSLNPVILKKVQGLTTTEAKELIKSEVAKGNIWARSRWTGGALKQIDFVPKKGSRCGEGKDKLNPCR